MTQMDLLLIEDESKVGHFLKDSLESEGCTVRFCDSYEEAVMQLEGPYPHPDVVILDRMLRGEDGTDLIPLIRKRHPDSQILILSAIDLPEEKARVLDMGADDYVAKPFSLSELSARLRVLARRKTAGATPRMLQVGNVTVDPASQGVAVQGRRLDLSKKEYQVFMLLLLPVGRVHNKFQMLDKIWDTQSSIETNTVEVTIKNLRKKLAASGASIEILSRRNVGYWIEA